MKKPVVIAIGVFILAACTVGLWLNHRSRTRPMATPVIPPRHQEWILPNGKFVVEMTPQRFGISGTVEFIPNPANCPPCERIRLVQVVKAISITDGVSDNNNWPPGEQNRTRLRTPQGWFVDHKSARWSWQDASASIYFNDSFPVDGQRSKDGFNHPPSAESAILYDAPGGNPIYRFSAETAVRCDDVNSPAAGQYLGSVQWGFIRGADRQGVIDTIAGAENVTPNFFDALQIFNAFYGTSF